MPDPPAEETFSRFARAFGSPLTAIQGSVRMLMLLTQVIPLYYDADARSRGYIETIDRQGQPARFPLMTIPMVIVTNEDRTIEHPGQIADIAAELKHRAKSIPGSIILRDRRGG